MRRAPGEGSIFRRPDGSWQGYFPWKGKRVYRRGETRAEVRAKLRQAHEELTRKAVAMASAETTEQFLLRWLYEQAKPTLKPNTFRNYKIRLKSISDVVGKIPLANLTHRDVSQALTHLSASWADSTLQNAYDQLATALKFAVAEGSIQRSPMLLVPRPRVEPVDRRRLSPEEMALLLDRYQTDWCGALWVMMLATGLRWSEAAALRWSDVLTGQGILTICQHVVRNHAATRPGQRGRANGCGWIVVPLTKTGRSYDVAMAPFGWDALAFERAQAEDRGEPTDGDHLIWHRREDTSLPVPHETVRKRWRAFCARYGLPYEALRLHDLRHTAGHTLYALTGDLKLVQDQLGHANIRTTAQIYARGRVGPRIQAGLDAFGALVGDAAKAKVSEAVSEAPLPDTA